MSTIHQSGLTFTLVLPTLNEIEGLRVILPRIRQHWSDDILVVDGGSVDGTIEFCRENGVNVHVQIKKGLANAEKEAYEKLRTDFFVLFTPDGNALPELLPALREKSLEGYDMVVVSRYKGGAKSEDDDFFTAIGNMGFTWLINFLFGAKYTDTLVGFRSIRCDAIARMRLHLQEEESWIRRSWTYLNAWEVAEATRAARLKMKVAEIPGDEPKRIGGVRKLSIIRNGTACLMQILMDFIWFRG